MTLDILAALEASPARGNGRCALGAFLDSIPEDQPGRDELIRLVETPHDRKADSDTMSGQKMAMVLSSPKIGFTTTQNPILDHRNHACRCYRS